LAGDSCNGSAGSTTASTLPDLERGFEGSSEIVSEVICTHPEDEEPSCGVREDDEEDEEAADFELEVLLDDEDEDCVVDGRSNSAGRLRGTACTEVMMRACLLNSS